MVTLVSASIGLFIAVLQMGVALSNGVHWSTALYQSALSGGIMALLGNHLFRKMIIAGLKTQQKLQEEAEAKAKAEIQASAANAEATSKPPAKK